MASVKIKIPLLMPFLLLGYLETLRLAAFYAFGLKAYPIFFITALLVVGCSVITHGRTQWKVKALSWLIILIFISLFGFVSYGGADTSNLIIIIGADSVYGLIIFMITGFILERSSAREFFFLGGFLMAAIAITSSEAIWPLVVLNFTMGIGLAGQLHLLSLEKDPRVRLPDGTGINSNIWGIVFLLIVAVITSLNVLFPVVAPKTEGITSVLHFVDSFTYLSENKFWDKLRKFEFNGTIPLDETAVMSVQSPRPSYWKGESFDLYTGRGWANSMPVRPVQEADFENHLLPDANITKVVQKFSFSPRTGSGVIYYGGVPAHINVYNDIALSAGQKMMTDNGGNFYVPQKQLAMSYEVVSYFIDFSPHQPRQDLKSYPAEIDTRYLQLPYIPERVHSLVKQITESAHSPYEKARKIEHYLSTNYPYDLIVKPAPANRDITDYFLFDLKKGYCTYHSTAMVVMLRAAGIPARWITGFTTGEYNTKEGVYEVKMSNAHAWVEAYFAGIGWVPFEPTSSFRLPEVSDIISSVSVMSGKQTESAGQTLKNSKFVTWKPSVKIALVVLAAPLIMAVIVLRRKAFHVSGSENMEQVYNLFLQLLAYKGHHKNAVQTPLEFAAQLVDTGDFNEEERTDIMYITKTYVHQRFGPDQKDGTGQGESINALKRLAHKWRIKTRD